MKKHNSNINKRSSHSQQFLTDTFINISGEKLSILEMSFRKKENKKWQTILLFLNGEKVRIMILQKIMIKSSAKRNRSLLLQKHKLLMLKEHFFFKTCTVKTIK